MTPPSPPAPSADDPYCSSWGRSLGEAGDANAIASFRSIERKVLAIVSSSAGFSLSCVDDGRLGAGARSKTG
jgi:hypothetical protein